MIIQLPGALLRFANYQREFEYDSKTLKTGLDRLMAQNPALKSALLDRKGKIRSAHLVFINGDQLDRESSDQALGAHDCVEIVTAIAGG
jgi:sulfur carrier protein ThiS